MMKTFQYSIICEDTAHSTFVGEFLSLTETNNSKLRFSLHNDCFKRWRFTNKSEVLKYYDEVAARSFKQYNIDLLFIVADFDDWALNKFNDYHDEYFNRLQTDLKGKTVLLLPVRAIEYWLWHINWSKDNTGSTKNVSIDNEPRPEIKKQIYGTKKPYKELCEMKVKEVMQSYNQDWLCSRSPSFNHFLTRFKKIVDQ